MLYRIDTVDDIAVEAADLEHLLETVHDHMHEFDREAMGEGNVRQLDRVHALVRIAIDKAGRLNEEVTTNSRKISGGISTLPTGRRATA